MKSKITKVVSVVLSLLVGVMMVGGTTLVYAEDEQAESDSSSAETGTSISLSPVSKVLDLSSKSEYKDSLEVKNEGDTEMEVEVYAAPYSYVYSEDENLYKLGFSKENNYTQITRWISLKDSNGHWTKKANYKIKPNDTLVVEYKIATPDNIPAGGQYAVIFAHTLTAVTSTSGIRTEASPGMIIYGRSTEGERVVSAEISDMKVEESVTENGATRNNFFASAKVKNTGNVDFNAVGVLKVEPILWGSSYETSGGRGRVSVIPESELVVTDEWEDSPSFGIYKVTWTVSAGESTEVIEKIVFLNPLPLIIITIMLLTTIIVLTIIIIRKRKERRARLAV